MDDAFLQQLTSLGGLTRTQVNVGHSNALAAHKDFKSLIIHRRLPDHGWTDAQIQLLLHLLSLLDTNHPQALQQQNTTTRWVGMGEREGRVYSSLVQQRCYGLSHGMGRSGDIGEAQPKAAGSSVLVQLTTKLVMDVIQRACGLTSMKHALAVPLCTGMSLQLVLQSMQLERPHKRKVLWSRIDQKSGFKSMMGLECIVVPTKMEGDQVITNLEALQAALEEHGDEVLAIMTTTSCFVPRVRDQVDEVAKLCQEHDVFHVINNAYGLQCPTVSKLINRGCTLGRVDAVISSMDKNFLVPVGGAIILSPHAERIQRTGKAYAGRASSAPLVDLFSTLLSMGLHGYQGLLAERQRLIETFPTRLNEVAEKHGERLLVTPLNSISYGITLSGSNVSRLGAMLFSRCVSGTRVVPRGSTKTIGSHTFENFGSSTDEFHTAYLTAACALGCTENEVDEFLKRLDKTLKEFKKKQSTSSEN